MKALTVMKRLKCIKSAVKTSPKLWSLSFFIFFLLTNSSAFCLANEPSVQPIQEANQVTESVTKTDEKTTVDPNTVVAETPIPKTSVLVAAEPPPDNISEKPLTIQMTPPRTLKMVEDERRQSYGYSEFGYSSIDKTYGYTVDGNKPPVEKRQFGYESLDTTPFGYSDPGNTTVGQSGFGKSGYGYVGNTSSYGRKEE